jgi:Family of unknown function (DUF6463)
MTIMVTRLRSAGWWLQALGMAHGVIGAVRYRTEIVDVIHRGVVDTIPDDGSTATAWWFLIVAPAIWCAGRLMRTLEQKEPSGKSLRIVGTVLGLVGALGALVMPRSPFSLVAVVGVAAILSARSRGQRDPSPRRSRRFEDPATARPAMRTHEIKPTRTGETHGNSS